MRITSITVDKIPNECPDCFFYKPYIEVDEDRLTDFNECKLKVWMGYPIFGIDLLPCPLNGKKKEEDCNVIQMSEL